ncbi:MAG TPA: DUF4249 domain-containing protein [Puia sp.]|nr:DUF4249 domain-containing protein [Puia sp.]
MPRNRSHTARFAACATALLLLAGLVTCRQSYNPPAVAAPNSYLVVDGFINTGRSAVTTFNLNRTRALNDSTTIGVPELHAQFTILGKHGDVYPLTDAGDSGIYSSGPLDLDTTQQYSIAITTADGRKYSSDAVPCKQSPPIDSVFWSQPGDLTVFAATHDPTGNSRYYRYDYTETWQHNARLIAAWTLVNDQIAVADSTDENWYCWSTANSTSVLITTSVALGQDLVTGFPLVTLPLGDPKAAVEYSILVRQYVITADAYNYWNLIEKTSQNVGTLFDLQPTQLIGNIHCVTNPSEPVIGYLSASSVQQQRIFIADSLLAGWVDPVPPPGCRTSGVPYSFDIFPTYPVSDTSVAPYYFSGPTMIVAPKSCLDCRYQGGTRIKPSFWR